MYKAVLFDMDGVLVDSERLAMEYMFKACEHFGFELRKDDFLALRSNTDEYCYEYYRERYGPGFDFYEIRDYRRKIMDEFVEREGLPLKPGVMEALESVRKAGLKLAVATSTHYGRAMDKLRLAGIADRFDMVISASMVEHGKPAPDVYLHAAEMVGEAPEDCIAVEDSPNGVASAHAAGCSVVIVPDLTEPNEEMRSKGTWVIRSLEELPRIIEGI